MLFQSWTEKIDRHRQHTHTHEPNIYQDNHPKLSWQSFRKLYAINWKYVSSFINVNAHAAYNLFGWCYLFLVNKKPIQNQSLFHLNCKYIRACRTVDNLRLYDFNFVTHTYTHTHMNMSTKWEIIFRLQSIWEKPQNESFPVVSFILSVAIEKEKTFFSLVMRTTKCHIQCQFCLEKAQQIHVIHATQTLSIS